MSRGEGTRRAFAMHEQLPFLAIYFVFLKLPNVMRHIVDKLQAELVL